MIHAPRLKLSYQYHQDNVYVPPPYIDGTPNSGDYFGPSSLGGPPGCDQCRSRSKKTNIAPPSPSPCQLNSSLSSVTFSLRGPKMSPVEVCGSSDPDIRHAISTEKVCDCDNPSPGTGIDIDDDDEDLDVDGQPMMSMPCIQVPSSDVTLDSTSMLNGTQCREALIRSIGDRLCQVKKTPIENHSINSITPATVLRYKLETYLQHRDIKTCCEDCSNKIDTSSFDVWSIKCDSSNPFTEYFAQFGIPGTHKTTPCSLCVKNPSTPEVRHSGKKGSTKKNKQKHQEEACAVCCGRGLVEHSAKLSVHFVNHQEEFVVQSPGVPDALLHAPDFTVIYQEQNKEVRPIEEFPLKELIDRSASIINCHTKVEANERIIEQRQTIAALHATRVHYTWKGKDGAYWVYGPENKVLCPDFPYTGCTTCTIL